MFTYFGTEILFAGTFSDFLILTEKTVYERGC